MAHSRVEFELQELTPMPHPFHFHEGLFSSTVTKYFSYSERVAYLPFFHKDLPIFIFFSLVVDDRPCDFLDNLIDRNFFDGSL
jgi:hypothetical protein